MKKHLTKYDTGYDTGNTMTGKIKQLTYKEFGVKINDIKHLCISNVQLHPSGIAREINLGNVKFIMLSEQNKLFKCVSEEILHGILVCHINDVKQFMRDNIIVDVDKAIKYIDSSDYTLNIYFDDKFYVELITDNIITRQVFDIEPFIEKLDRIFFNTNKHHKYGHINCKNFSLYFNVRADTIPSMKHFLRWFFKNFDSYFFNVCKYILLDIRENVYEFHLSIESTHKSVSIHSDVLSDEFKNEIVVEYMKEKSKVYDEMFDKI